MTSHTRTVTTHVFVHKNPTCLCAVLIILTIIGGAAFILPKFGYFDECICKFTNDTSRQISFSSEDQVQYILDADLVFRKLPYLLNSAKRLPLNYIKPLPHDDWSPNYPTFDFDCAIIAIKGKNSLAIKFKRMYNDHPGCYTDGQLFDDDEHHLACWVNNTQSIAYLDWKQLKID